MAQLTLIVAATLSNGIGQSSRLPWRLPQEMAYFARVTTNAPEGSTNAVIMGRNTWESIPKKFRPLPRRMNVVISRNADYSLNNSKVVENATKEEPSLHTSFRSAIEQVTHETNENTKIHRTFIIGGATIYREALNAASQSSQGVHGATPQEDSSLPIADRILLTRIVAPTFEDCDVFIPEFRDMKDRRGEPLWKQATHEQLEEWVGGEVPRGVQEEKGVQYEFQMWTRQREDEM